MEMLRRVQLTCCSQAEDWRPFLAGLKETKRQREEALRGETENKPSVSHCKAVILQNTMQLDDFK